MTLKEEFREYLQNNPLSDFALISDTLAEWFEWFLDKMEERTKYTQKPISEIRIGTNNKNWQPNPFEEETL